MHHRRPRILLVAPPGSRGKPCGARVAAFLRSLKACGEVRICAQDCGHAVKRAGVVAVDPEQVENSIDREMRGFEFDALVFLDGGAARTVLDAAKKRTGLPAALAALPDDLPGAWPRPSCSPDELWWFSAAQPVTGVDGLVPGSYHWLPRPNAPWLRRRLAGLVKGVPAPAARSNDLASLIIPCWNGLSYIKECLGSVRSWTRPPYEVIAIDNGSDMATRRFLAGQRRRNRGFRLIQNDSNRGFAAAINQGMRAAKGRRLVWLNSDIVVTPGWLERLEACADKAPWIGAVGPMTNSEPGRALEARAFSLKATLHSARAVSMANAGRAGSAYWLQGFCLLLKREAVERVGFLDGRFGQAFFEDYDYCLRLRQAGYELAIAEDVFVYHHWHKSFADKKTRTRQMELNRQVWIEKWCRRSFEFLSEFMNEQEPDMRRPSGLARRSAALSVQMLRP